MEKEYVKYYRGESKDYKETKCVPLLFRQDWFSLIEEKNYYEYLIDRFSEVAVFDKIEKDSKKYGYYYLKKLGALQHYGYYTRLLDISRSLDIARYFASSSNFREDGYVYSFDSKKNREIKTLTADSVLKKIECIIEAESISKKNVWEELDIKSNAKYIITNNIIVDYKLTLKDVIGTATDNLRLEKQHGAFMLFGQKTDENGHLLDEYNELEIEEKETIEADEKMPILIDLAFPEGDKESISNISIFPDSEKSMDIIAKYAEIRMVKNNNKKNSNDLEELFKKICESKLKDYEANDDKEKRTKGLTVTNKERIKELLVSNIDTITKSVIIFTFVFIEFIRYANDIKDYNTIENTFNKIIERFKKVYL